MFTICGMVRLQLHIGLFILIYFLTLFVITFHCIAKKLQRRKQISGFRKARGCASLPQTPKAWLGLPQVLQLIQALRANKFLEYVQGLFSRYGHTFSYNTFDAQSIWTTEPENIQACLSTKSHDFEVGASRHKALLPLVGRSILTTDGGAWAHHRSLIRPNFVKSQLADFDIFEKHFSNLIDCVPKDDSTFDLRELLQKLTMDISTDFLLGHSTNSLALHAMGKKDEFSDAWNIAISWLPLRCHLGAVMDWIPHPAFFRACSTVHLYADRLLDLAFALHRGVTKDDSVTGNRYIFLHELAKEVTDRIQLRDHVISVLSAGRDSTAELLSCTIDLLTIHHDVLRNLRKEVYQLNGQKPTAEQLKDMKYLKNVLFEVLRLYPVGPVNARIATVDTTLPLGGGPDGEQPVMVKRGQQVLYCVYGLHRRKDIYGFDADEFRPERWVDRHQGGWDFLPFNAGARNCLGQNFAITEASYILVRLLQEFDEIKGRGSTTWEEHLGLILTNFHGTMVGLTRKSQP